MQESLIIAVLTLPKENIAGRYSLIGHISLVAFVKLTVGQMWA